MFDELKVLMKYVISAGASFAIDLLLFTVFHTLLNARMGSISIVVSTVLARILSSLFNYFMNSRLVFKQWDKTSIVKYYALVVVQMCVSAGSVYGLSMVFTGIYTTYIKVFVDVIIFVVNYLVQKTVIFRKDNNS